MPRKTKDTENDSVIRSRVITDAKRGETSSTVIRSKVLGGGEAAEPTPARKSARKSSRTATAPSTKKAKKAASAASDTNNSSE